MAELTPLIIQSGRAGDVVPYLADRELTLVSVTASSPGPGYVTVGVRRQEQPAPAPLLVVGERHTPGSTGRAFSGSGSSARRLNDLLGAPVLELAETVNLMDGVGAWSPYATPADRADELHHSWPGWILVCGRQAAQAFGLADTLVWHGRLGAIPHPSGRCRAWNDPEYVTAAKLFVQPAVSSALATDLELTEPAAT
jgi:hypothetical protein